VAVVVATLLAASLGWASLPSAQADKLSEAKDKLTQLQGDAAQAAEEYNQVQAKLDAASTKLDQDRRSIQDQQAKVDSLRDQVVMISLQQFQDRGITSAAALFTSSNQDQALTSFLVSSQVNDTTQALLQNYQLGQASLADMERSQQATVDSITADKARLEELKTTADKAVDDAQKVVDNLTEQERRALEAAQAAAAARAQAGDPVGGGGGGGGAAVPDIPPVQNGAAAAAIVEWAKARVGYAYVYGGSGPSSYDCSGFTQAAYASIGISLPHSATTQFNYGQAVPMHDLQPGDLVFFYDGPGHVEIYVGGGMTIGARNERLGVVYRPLDGYMTVVGARRLL
jgi:cell wall-associated NlpC family hydrolase